MSERPAATFRLGDWTIDAASGAIERDGQHVRLEPRVMAVLQHLAARPGEVATKEEIIDAVWADTFVGEAALSRCVSELRRALGDDARSPRYIETLPKRGYRLVAPVEAIAAAPRAHGPRRWIGAAALIVALSVLAVLVRPGTPADPTIDSIAVLPLRALSDDPDQRFFAEGLTEQLITQLAAVEGIGVISGMAARQARDAEAPLRELAEALGVDAVIDGTVQRAGDRILVALELAEASAEELMWAGSYREIGEDWLEVQQEVATQAAREIELTLAARNGAVRVTRPLAPEAAQALERARRLAARGNPVDAVRSLDFLRRALEIDPEHAPTWAAQADVHAMLAWHNWSPPVAAYAQARASAHAALDRDPTLADAHALLAAVAAELNQDWPEAERRFRTAIELDPESAYARERYGRYLRRMGDVEGALAQSSVAHSLAPDAPAMAISHGWNLLLAGRSSEAREALEQVLMLEQGLAHAYAALCAIDNLEGRFDIAVATCRRAAAVPGHGGMLGAVGYALARAGDRQGAAAVLAQVGEIGGGEATEIAVATVHVGLGDHDSAFDVLEAAAARRSLWVAAVLESPYLAELRGRPRMRALLRDLFILEAGDA